MSIEINMGEDTPIRFGLTGPDEIIQNVRMILFTIQGTLPLDRAFGIDPDMIDEPIPILKARMAAEIVLKIQTYEPRAAVSEVTFQDDNRTGRLVPIVRIDPAGLEVSG